MKFNSNHHKEVQVYSYLYSTIDFKVTLFKSLKKSFSTEDSAFDLAVSFE